MGLALDSSGLRMTSGNTKLSAERIKAATPATGHCSGDSPFFMTFLLAFLLASLEECFL